MTQPANWNPYVELNAEFVNKASTLYAAGDLLYWSSGDNAPLPAANLADLGTAALMQAAFARLFVGVNRSPCLASDATQRALRVSIDRIVEIACDSSTFAIGDYVGASYNTNVLRNQQVAKVSYPHLAIGRVVKRYASATTKVKCRLMSRYLLGLHDRYRDFGSVGQGLSSTAMTDANQTLTVDADQNQTMVPTAARTVTLPAVAQSAGLAFRIVNNGTTGFAITVQNAGAVAIGLVGQGQRGIFYCDGTTWFGQTGGGSATAVISPASLLSSSSSAGVGYATGAGGAVTQATNRTTGVTLSKLTGTITTNNASLAAEAAAKFTVTNTTVAIGDTIVLSQQSGSNGGNTSVEVVAVAAGSFDIMVSNNNAAGGTAETGAILINFAVIKAVSS